MSYFDEKLQTASNIDSFIDLYIIDEKNNNMFDPKYQGLNNLEVLILKNGHFLRFYNPLIYASNGYVVNSDFSIRLFLNLPPINKNYSHTYIRFNKNKIITIRTEFRISHSQLTDSVRFGGGSIVKERIWFNNKLIWDLTLAPTTVPYVDIASY